MEFGEGTAGLLFETAEIGEAGVETGVELDDEARETTGAKEEEGGEATDADVLAVGEGEITAGAGTDVVTGVGAGGKEGEDVLTIVGDEEAVDVAEAGTEESEGARGPEGEAAEATGVVPEVGGEATGAEVGTETGADVVSVGLEICEEAPVAPVGGMIAAVNAGSVAILSILG